MKRLKLFIAGVAIALSLAPTLAAVPALAAPTNVFQETCKAKGSGDSAICQTNGSDPLTGDNGILVKVSRVISFLTGVAAVILILVSALMYVMSDGDSGKLQSSKSTLIYAVVGLIISGVAQGIVVLVVKAL